MVERITFFGYKELEEGLHSKTKVGGKGANLLELTEQGFPVPEGFIVTTEAFQEFLEERGIGGRLDDRSGIDPADPERAEEIQETMKRRITTTELPDSIREDLRDAYSVIGEETVAVRSSATAEDLPDASFAGQLETYLNVQGVEGLIEAVQKCWASVFTQRAIIYRAEKGYDPIDADIAVVVQKMIDAEKSGVLFTVNPETGDDETVVEASWGLGESVVGGEVTPDQYVVNDGELVNETINQKQVMYTRDTESGETIKRTVPEEKRRERVLSENELKRLSEVSQKVARYFNKPQDIEWAIVDDELYLLQTRPITTISERRPENGDTVRGRQLAEGLGVSTGVARGRICLTPIQAAKLDKEGEDVILVREQTSPSDMHGIKAATGILTSQGGTTSHAAIVARELEKPAVVGCEKLEIQTGRDCVRIGDETFEEGDRIAIDGERGEVLEFAPSGEVQG